MNFRIEIDQIAYLNYPFVIDNTKHPIAGAPGNSPINIELNYTITAKGNNNKQNNFVIVIVTVVVISGILAAIIYKLNRTYKKIKTSYSLLNNTKSRSISSDKTI
jgi:hypothetical protein